MNQYAAMHSFIVFCSTRTVWEVTLPLALCSNVPLVFLSKPSAALPCTVLAVLFGLSCELYFSAVISFFQFHLLDPSLPVLSSTRSPVTQGSRHADVLPRV